MRCGARAQYTLTVRAAARLALVVLGPSAVVCGASWLTGNWLGLDVSHSSVEAVPNPLGNGYSVVHHSGVLEAVALIALGLALTAYGAWPRRRRPPT